MRKGLQDVCDRHWLSPTYTPPPPHPPTPHLQRWSHNHRLPLSPSCPPRPVGEAPLLRNLCRFDGASKERDLAYAPLGYPSSPWRARILEPQRRKPNRPSWSPFLCYRQVFNIRYYRACSVTPNMLSGSHWSHLPFLVCPHEENERDVRKKSAFSCVLL